eukprot:6243255-Prymnesium_polylepis.1
MHCNKLAQASDELRNPRSMAAATLWALLSDDKRGVVFRCLVPSLSWMARGYLRIRCAPPAPGMPRRSLAARTFACSPASAHR